MYAIKNTLCLFPTSSDVAKFPQTTFQSQTVRFGGIPVLMNALIRSASLLCFFVDFCFTFSSVCVPMVRMGGLEGTLTVLTDPDFLVLHIRA